MDSSAPYVWEKKGIGWRFCGLSEDECKAACSAMGPCAEVVISGNGCCYPAASECVGTERSNDKKLVATSCEAGPPPSSAPPPPDIPHAGWTSLSSFPSIAIGDAEQPTAFLARCKGTCLDTADCIGFVESGCDEAGCTLCELKSAASDSSYIVPAFHTYLWLGGSSPASSYTPSARGGVSVHDASSNEYGATRTADEEAAPLGLATDAGSLGDAGQFTFTATEVAAGISTFVLSALLNCGVLALACIRCCRGRLGLRKSPRKLNIPIPAYYLNELSTIPVAPVRGPAASRPQSRESI